MLSRCARFAPQVKRSKLHIVEAQGLIAKRFSGSLEFWMMLRIQDWGWADAFNVRAHGWEIAPP